MDLSGIVTVVSERPFQQPVEEMASDLRMEREIAVLGRKQLRLLGLLEDKKTEFYGSYSSFPWWQETRRRKAELYAMMDQVNEWRRREYELREELTLKTQKREHAKLFRVFMENYRQADLVIAKEKEQQAKLKEERRKIELELQVMDTIIWDIRDLFVANPYNNGYEQYLDGINNLFEEFVVPEEEMVLNQPQVLSLEVRDLDAHNMLDEMLVTCLCENTKVTLFSCVLCYNLAGDMYGIVRWPTGIGTQLSLRESYKNKEHDCLNAYMISFDHPIVVVSRSSGLGNGCDSTLFLIHDMLWDEIYMTFLLLLHSKLLDKMGQMSSALWEVILNKFWGKEGIELMQKVPTGIGTSQSSSESMVWGVIDSLNEYLGYNNSLMVTMVDQQKIGLCCQVILDGKGYGFKEAGNEVSKKWVVVQEGGVFKSSIDRVEYAFAGVCDNTSLKVTAYNKYNESLNFDFKRQRDSEKMVWLLLKWRGSWPKWRSKSMHHRGNMASILFNPVDENYFAKRSLYAKDNRGGGLVSQVVIGSSFEKSDDAVKSHYGDSTPSPAISEFITSEFIKDHEAEIEGNHAVLPSSTELVALILALQANKIFQHDVQIYGYTSDELFKKRRTDALFSNRPAWTWSSYQVLYEFSVILLVTLDSYILITSKNWNSMQLHMKLYESTRKFMEGKVQYNNFLQRMQQTLETSQHATLGDSRIVHLYKQVLLYDESLGMELEIKPKYCQVMYIMDCLSTTMLVSLTVTTRKELGIIDDYYSFKPVKYPLKTLQHKSGGVQIGEVATVGIDPVGSLNVDTKWGYSRWGKEMKARKKAWFMNNETYDAQNCMGKCFHPCLEEEEEGKLKAYSCLVFQSGNLEVHNLIQQIKGAMSGENGLSWVLFGITKGPKAMQFEIEKDKDVNWKFETADRKLVLLYKLEASLMISSKCSKWVCWVSFTCGTILKGGCKGVCSFFIRKQTDDKEPHIGWSQSLMQVRMAMRNDGTIAQYLFEHSRVAPEDAYDLRAQSPGFDQFTRLEVKPLIRKGQCHDFSLFTKISKGNVVISRRGVAGIKTAAYLEEAMHRRFGDYHRSVFFNSKVGGPKPELDDDEREAEIERIKLELGFEGSFI